MFSQLGLTQEILNGSASPEVMQNYYSRTIEPIVGAVVDECYRKFLTLKEQQSRESIDYFRDPFKLIPVDKIAEISDKMTRNEIMTSNEVRQAIGMKPSKDPSADELRNKNLSEPKGVRKQIPEGDEDSEISEKTAKKGADQNG